MKKLNAVLLIIIVVLGGTIFVQRRTIRRVEAQNERLLSENARTTSSENVKPDHGAAEEEGLRERDRSELLRLRAEVNALKRAANHASSNLSAHSVAAVSNTQTSVSAPEAPIKVFETTAEAVLQPGETFMTGGWETSPGKRTVVLASPEIIDAAGNVDRSGNQIVVRTHFVEMPEAVLQSLIGGSARAASTPQSGRSDGIVEATFSESGSRELLEQLRNTTGVDILLAPAVTTLNGRRAQVAVQDARTADGQQNGVGTSIDFVPVIAQNGGISLSVAPRIVLPNPNSRC